MPINEQYRPPEERIEAVESKLYNRMVRNAFGGFLKAAAIAAVIGFAVGAILAPAIAGTEIAHVMGFAHTTEAFGFILDGLKTALVFGGIAGSIGAVAGIQSTRDTRRFFMMHESRSPEDIRETGIQIVPEPPAPEKETHFQDKVCGCGKSEQPAIHAR